MATMATTHGLSVLANLSIKPPVDPKTGLVTTLSERKTPAYYLGTYDYDDSNARYETFAKSADPASLMHLSNLSDEEFYSKLLELKNEQKKILQKCERIYLEKHKGSNSQTFPVNGRSLEQTDSLDQVLRSKTFVDEDGILTAVRTDTLTPVRSRSPVLEEKEFKEEEEVLTQTFSKPPSGRHTLPSGSRSPLQRPKSAPLSREIAKSLDELRSSVEELRKSFEYSDDECIPDDTVSEPYRKKDQAMARFEKMWQNFSVEDYAPRRSLERPSSATIIRQENKKKDDSWRHRLTIPKPFTMTLRDETKDKKKSKTMMEFEEKLNQKQIEDEEEMKKKFKARPVPAHVYLPLYDEIQEKSEERRRHIRKASIELLKSQEKPFSFMKREEDKKQHLTMNTDCTQPKKMEEVKGTFKAKPVPKKIFDGTVDDKLMEEEEYRKIRIKMRAEEMLKTASLPPNMRTREQLKEQQERQQKLKSRKKNSKGASRPRINHDVPNYDALYRQFQQELQRRKAMKEATISKPFQLETQRTSRSAREKIKKEIERDESARKENRWPYTLNSGRVKLGHMSSSLDALPAKSTRTADCRSSKTRHHMQKLSEQELREIEDDRHRRVREIKLRREIQGKTKETPRPRPEEKRKEFREAERSRMEEYERELMEMKERVQRRPLLFEQESQVNAKKKAEKKFNATLKSVGLDEDFVETRGSRSASVHDYTDTYDDDDYEDEDTAVKHTEETYTKHHDSAESLSPEEA